MPHDTLLGGLRVLDLAGEDGVLCGRALADMGAEVIKVEPPSGDSQRRLGPFFHDETHHERSLWWFAYCAGKRSITINLESLGGRVLFRQLAGTVDVLIESFALGYMDRLGLSYHELAAFNPRLIYVSVSTFGREGPRASWLGSDLVAMAAGGVMYTQGDEDRPPTAFAFPQACFFAGAEALAGTMFALAARRQAGRGQYVDVSAQESVIWTIMNNHLFWDLNKVNVGRSGSVKRRPDGATNRYYWPSKDGYVTFVGGGEWAGLSRWMKAEGVNDKRLERDWTKFSSLSATQQEMDDLKDMAEAFFRGRTSQELYDGAVQWRFMLYPIFSTADLLRYRQLEVRDYWVQVEHEDLGKRITYPGTFVKTSACQPRLRGRAPYLGEHNDAVYLGEMGLSSAELVALKAEGAI